MKERLQGKTGNQGNHRKGHHPHLGGAGTGVETAQLPVKTTQKEENRDKTRSRVDRFGSIMGFWWGKSVKTVILPTKASHCSFYLSLWLVGINTPSTSVARPGVRIWKSHGMRRRETRIRISKLFNKMIEIKKGLVSARFFIDSTLEKI